MRSGYIFIGMPLGVLWRLVRENGISWSPRHLLRLLFALQAALWSSVVAWLERRNSGVGRRLQDTTPRPDPVIIISHWRTGTTLLQQLMSRDERLMSPTYFHCSLPHSFLTSAPVARPILGRAIRGPRPMDNMLMGFDEPAEEEYALFRMTGLPPLSRLVFARDGRYFLDGDETLLPDAPGDQARWEEAYLTFMARLHLAGGGRQVLLKNPFGGPRIPTLLRLFPEARFVHIQRNPLDVVPSTVRLWTILGRDNTLSRRWRPPTVDEVVRVLGRFNRRIRQDLDPLPPGRVARLRFEDLERDPRTTLRGVYEQLNMTYTGQLDEAVEQLWLSRRNYKKNKHELSAEDEALIRRELGEYIPAG